METTSHLGKRKAFSHLSKKYPDEYPKVRANIIDQVIGDQVVKVIIDQVIVDQVEVILYGYGPQKNGFINFLLSWYTYQDCPYLDMHDGGHCWDLFHAFPELFRLLSVDETIEPQEICDFLLSLGVEDWTHTNP